MPDGLAGNFAPERGADEGGGLGSGLGVRWAAGLGAPEGGGNGLST